MKRCYVIPTPSCGTYYKKYGKIACIKYEDGECIQRIVYGNGNYDDTEWAISDGDEVYFPDIEDFKDHFSGHKSQFWKIVSRKEANNYVKELIKNAPNKR